MSDLKEVLKEKNSAFSGNSGVGKSSLTKTIIPNIDEKIEVNTIGEKSNRGRHTTKYVKLYSLDKDTYLLDTPGFSSFELFDISYKDLKKYYSEFNKFRCDYEDCNHIKEDKSVCEIKRKVEEGVIDSLRYERYVYIFNKLKEQEDRKYK
jgi:ribosome biogenesis GTPase